MRTKTLLLSAAALLAAGFVSTQAQPVYSQNIVGYASVASATANKNYLETVPFVIGSNGVNEVFGSTLPLGSKILIWNGVAAYNLYYYDDPGDGPGFLASDDTTHLTSFPQLKPGVGFFLVPAQPITNTYAGTVSVNVGTSNQMAFPTANVNYLVASVVPYAGAVTNGNNSTGGPNLNGLPLGSKVLIWNGVSAYNLFYYDDPGDGAGWLLSDDTTHTAPPSISVGQGFFVIPAQPYTWTTGL